MNEDEFQKYLDFWISMVVVVVVVVKGWRGDKT